MSPTDDQKSSPESILAEAARIVDGPRRTDYGTPAENHGRTAALWAAYLGVPITARDVCILNVLQKASRDRHGPKRDNLVDIAGYARNAELCPVPAVQVPDHWVCRRPDANSATGQCGAFNNTRRTYCHACGGSHVETVSDVKPAAVEFTLCNCAGRTVVRDAGSATYRCVTCGGVTNV